MEDTKKIAYLIAAHSDPAHLERLIGALDDRADFFIHIDKKQAIAPFTARIKGPNVFFLANEDRIKVYWGAFSQVQATLNLLDHCLEANNRNPSPYKKVVFLSGADYPIKNNEYIHRFFEENKDINFIRGMNITQANTKKYNYCIRNYLFFNFSLYTSILTRVVRKILNTTVNWVKKKPNAISLRGGGRLDVFHGSSWWALNTDVIAYIRQYAADHGEVANYFKYSLASDEKFFHTLFFNSHFASTNLYRGEEPYKPFTSAFANLHIIDHSLQKWFDLNDFNQIEDAEQLFVRKVSSVHSNPLLDRIDRELLGKHRYES